MKELAVCFALTLLLDAALGEPPNRFHPVAWFGQCAARVETLCRRLAGNGVFAGLVAWLVMVVPLPAAAAAAIRHLGILHPAAAPVAAAAVAYFCIALRSLHDHAERIAAPLARGDLPAARLALSRIVSRETDGLPESEIVRGAIESLGENLIDAVTAVWFWMFAGYFAGGLPGAVACAVLLREINTLDACWGYRNERYLRFGRIAARSDDAVCFLPARLTLIAVAAAAPLVGGSPWKTLTTGWRHRGDHPSPNSTFGMAGFAGALGIGLGGPTVYRDGVERYPVWGRGRRELDRRDLRRAEILTWGGGIVFPLLLLGGGLLWRTVFF